MNFPAPPAGAVFAALSNCKNHDNGGLPDSRHTFSRWRDFCQVIAKTVTAGSPETTYGAGKLGRSVAEPFSSLLDDVPSLELPTLTVFRTFYLNDFSTFRKVRASIKSLSNIVAFFSLAKNHF